MTRFGLFCAAIVLCGGCVDDRAKVKSEVFFCDPTSPTADTDCGAGFTCYSATQALGRSICAPACDPANPKTCDGACTQSGACLSRCTVPATDQPNPCPSPLTCRRITDSPLERALGPDGICLAINASCSTSADCTSPIFDGCSSEVDGATQGNGLLTDGEICVEASCFADGIACQPGSACIKDILPSQVPAPDLCSPICDSIRARTQSSSDAFNECLPGLTCLSDAFPSTNAGACAPGFPGWICVDNLGCSAGGCTDWGDVDPAMQQFLTCSPRCNSDADCVPYDRGSNPSIVTHFTCHHAGGDGWCRNLSSLFFPLTCLRSGDACVLDSEATCTAPPPATSPDGGVPLCAGAINTGAMGLGALGGSAPSCNHACTQRSDCDTLSAAAHVPMRCEPGPSPSPSTSTGGVCTPELPFIAHCSDDGDCFGGLHCIDLGGTSTCTLSCTSSDDCANNDVLGTSFVCAGNNVCVPKTESGCAGASADFCLSGQAVGGACVSPTGWACDHDAQCASGSCVFLSDTTPAFGRCT